TGPSGAPQDLSDSADDPLDGVALPQLFEEGESASNIKSGTGFAGSVGINFIRDTDLAYINARGSVRADTLSLNAENSTSYVAITGGVAVSKSSGTALGGGTAIGGAFGLNQITADTEAFIVDKLAPSAGTDVNGLTVTSTAADAANVDEIAIIAKRSGSLVTFTAGVAVNTNEQGKSYAGSISINRLVDTTKAMVDGANLVAAGNVRQDARNEAQAIAIGGGVSYSKGAKGVGFSVGFNQLSAETNAGIIGTIRRASINAGAAYSVTALNDQKLWAFAVSLGIATGGGLDSSAVAFTLGINIVSTDETIFSRDNSSQILATISNADVTASSVSLEAKDNSVIYAVAGAIGVGSQGSAYGIGLGWNQVALKVRTTVDNSTVNAGAGGISMTAHSTQDGPISIAGKIAAAAVGGSKGNSTAVGGSLSVNGIYNTIESTVTNGSDLTTTSGGGVSVTASDDSTINALTGGVAISSNSSAVGAAISANYIANRVTAKVDGSSVDANGDVTISGHQGAAIHSLTIGGAGGSTTSVAGSLSINVINNDVTSAIVGGTADVAAHGNVRVKADNSASIVTIAGSLAAGGKVGVGASLTNATIVDTTKAYIDGAAKVSADGATATFEDVLGATHSGVSIEADSAENIVIVAVGGAFTSEVAVSGAVSFTYIDVTAKAYQDAPSVAAASDDGITSKKDIDIAAHGHMTLVGVAGALAGSSEVGVGIGADAGYVKRTIEASIGAGATAKADDDVIVATTGDIILTSVSAAISGGGEGAGNLTAGVSILDLTARAYIGSGAVVTADGNVLVSAEDTTTLNQVSGNIAGAGEGAAGIAAGIGVLNKTTEAYIAQDAQVTAFAKAGEGGIVANTGGFGAPASGTNDQDDGASADFKGTDVTYSTNSIHADDHGMSTGQEVVYTAESLALGGLQTGTHYYVIRIDANHFALATSKANAQAGTRIDLVDNGIDSGASHVVQTLNNTGVPVIDNQAFNDPGVYSNRDRTPLKATQTGLIIVAVSVNDLASAGVGVAIAGEGSGTLAGSLSIHNIDTRAYIDQGAKINAGATNATDAGTGQNVLVAAGRTYNQLSIGGGLAGSGGFSAAPAFAAPVLKGSTEAFIQGATSGSTYNTVVNARGDVGVIAQARTDIIDVAAGIAAAGEVGIAGSAAVIVIDTTTLASISGRVRMAADGNVLVAATDDTTTYAIGGAVGVGLAGGGGAGAVDVTSIEKKTIATIGDSAIVDAEGNSAGFISSVPTGAFTSGGAIATETIRGVAVLAKSSEDLVSVAASIGGGLYVGIAGGVTVESVDSDTLATIATGAQVNQNTASSANSSQSVVVAATNTLDILTYAGGLGVGAGGIGASVDVGILRNDTQAYIGAASVRAMNDVNTFALSDWTIDANSISAGAGAGGLGGGIIVYQIGGNFTDSYSTSGGSSGALDGDGSSVLDFVNTTVDTLTGDMATEDDSPLPFNPATAVDSNAETIDLGEDRGLKTGDTLIYSSGGGTAVGGLTNGQAYYAIVDASDPTKVKLAATFEDAQAGTAIDLDGSVATGSSHNLANGNAQMGNIARSEIGSSSPAGRVSGAVNATQNLTSGTTAGILSGAVIDATNVAVKANQQLDYTARAGGIGLGAVGLGVGIVVVNVDADATAFVAPGVAISGLNPSVGTLVIDATLNSDVRSLGFAGALSGFVSLGGAVSVITDNSSARAMLGATPSPGDDVSTSEAQSHVTQTVVTGFKSVSVTSTATINHRLADGVVSVSGIAGLGAAVSSVTIDGGTQAIIGDYTLVGTEGTEIGGDVTVETTRTITLNPYNSGDPMGIAVGGGLVGVAAGATIIDVEGASTARVGEYAEVHATGDVKTKANGTITATSMEIDGGAVGGLAIGFVIATVAMRPTVEASFGANSVIRGRKVNLEADNTVDASLEGVAAGGGILSGQGLDVELTVDPTTSVTVGAGADIAAVQSVTVTSTADMTAEASGNAGSYGGVAVIVGGSTANLTNTNTATIGDGSVITGGTAVDIRASSTNDASALGDGGTGGLVAVIISDATVVESDETHTNVGAGAQITSGTNLTVESRTSSTGFANPDASAGGIGADTETTGTLTYNGSTITDIGANAVLKASETLDVLARVTMLDLTVDAVSESSALGANSDATATIDRPADTPTSDAQVVIHAGADLTGDTAVNVKARHESITSMAISDATTNGLGAATDAYSNNDFDVETRVMTETGSEIHTRNLTVEAFGDQSISGFTSPTVHGAAIDTGDSHTDETLVYQRTIDFNSGVFLFGPPSPELVVNSLGQITKRVGMSAPTINATDIILPSIVNNSTAAGRATFNIPTWGNDPTPAGYNTTQGEDSIKGNASFTFLTAFDHITVTNASTRNVVIGLIDPVAATPNYASNLTINVTETSQFVTTTTSDPGHTEIVVSNTATSGDPDIVVNGAIRNSLGPVTLSTLKGDITNSATGRIEAAALTFDAPDGMIGTALAPMLTASTRLDATAHDGVYVSETGNLELGAVVSTTGTVKLTATGSILDADGSVFVNVDAPTINLSAGNGSIGTTTDALRVDADRASGHLTAIATGDIVITDVAGGVGIASISTSTGDIFLTTVDTSATGEDIVLGATSSIAATLGDVTLKAGDGILMAEGSTIAGVASVNLEGDVGNADGGVGAVFDLEGSISGAAIAVRGGTDRDTYAIRRVVTGTAMTVHPGGAEDIILVGDKATATLDANGVLTSATNTGGKLSGIAGTLTVAGSSDKLAALQLDSSGSPQASTGVLVAGSVTGFGMAGSVVYSDIKSLELDLGTAADAVTVRSTTGGMTTLIDLGGGNDSARVASTLDTLNDIDGALTILGGTGIDTLELDDSGDTVANTGIIGGSNGNQVFGFGMGDPDQTVVNLA
ncbi:MAG: hypothetical protein KDJ77_07865, partial [Rhodobiaceae bacterium]|nr:hypothetical protein [Rhodobiaceae bacterium]